MISITFDQISADLFQSKGKDTHNTSKYGGHLQSKLDYNLLLSNSICHCTENAKKV